MQLENNQLKIMRTMDDLENKVAISSVDIIFLKQEIKKIGTTVNRLTDDVNLFKEKAVEVQFITSYIVSRLVVGKGVVLETKRLWRKKKMDDQFFEFLTLPCGSSCPLENGEFKSCVFDEEENSLYLDFLVPIVNQNLTIVEADPFFLMVREKGQICKVIYDGPQTALVSEQEDCVYSTGKDHRGQYLVTPSTSCTKLSLYEKENGFKLDKCIPSEEGSAEAFIHVKAYNNFFYVYCPSFSFTFGMTRNVQCPLSVFKLPLSATFTLNNVTFQGQMLNLVYNEREDPLFLEKVTWHLTPLVNWDELNRTFPILSPLNSNHWGRGSDSDFWIIMMAIGCGFILMGFIILWKKSNCKCARKKRYTRKVHRRMNLEMKTLGVGTHDSRSTEEEVIYVS